MITDLLETEEELQEPSLEDELRLIEAAKRVACARHSLTCLQEKLGNGEKYSEIAEAIANLQVALNILTAGTGGML